MSDDCDMVIIEYADFSISWECSECSTKYKPTAKFEKNKKCPACDRTIKKWVGLDDCEED